MDVYHGFLTLTAFTRSSGLLVPSLKWTACQMRRIIGFVRRINKGCGMRFLESLSLPSPTQRTGFRLCVVPYRENDWK